ncbi:MAG: GntR family transcriptional regulator [Actinobacteria bacterium HGW-Actinobacteria-11]|nr:MAG: GntR family transcriptional regulator [Actinobacteria bacterium HGW-Actinobacteria-11]
MPVPTTPHKNARVTLRETVTQQIREAIFDGTLQPGEHLNDGELQEWLGVSRTPIREALNELSRVGLIEMIPQRYTRVAKPRPAERTFMLQTIGAFMGGVVRVTVPVLTKRQRSSLLSATEQVLALVAARDHVSSGRGAWVLVDRFLEFCPNPILVRATKDTIDSLAYQLSVTRTADSTRWPDLDAGYPALKTALVEGDAVAAELAIERVFRLSAASSDDAQSHAPRGEEGSAPAGNTLEGPPLGPGVLDDRVLVR